MNALGRMTTQEISRLLTQVTIMPNGCWEWGTLDGDGYGKVKHDGRTMGAHRYVWSVVYGQPPADLELDHLCRNRACVNPGHLEPVTPKENIRRKLLAMNVVWCDKHARFKSRNRQGRLLCYPCRAEQAKGYRAKATA